MNHKTSNPEQLGFDLTEDVSQQAGVYSLAAMRQDLREMLAAAKMVTHGNLWSGQEHRFNKAVFRELCRNLPEEEGAQLSFEFFEEIERIESLMAA